MLRLTPRGILARSVVAHWFAFSLAAFATGTKDSRRERALHSLTGIAGVMFVGLLVTGTCLFVPPEIEALAVIIVLVIDTLIAAFVTARNREAGFLSTLLIVVVVLALALSIILLKNFLD